MIYILFALFLPETCYALFQTNYKLNINDQLVVFSSCTVHITLNELEESRSHHVSRNTRETGKYDFVAPNFPKILSIQRFGSLVDKRLSKYEYTAVKCNEKTVYWNSSQEFKFRAAPSQKLTCAVQVYITPKNCGTWKAAEIYRLEEDEQNMRKYLPTTFFDPVMDYRISKPIQTASKSRWFFIFVENSLKYRYIYPDETFFNVDYAYNLGIVPTKIWFQLVYVPTNDMFVVSKTYFVSLLDSFKLFNSWAIKHVLDAFRQRYPPIILALFPKNFESEGISRFIKSTASTYFSMIGTPYIPRKYNKTDNCRMCFDEKTMKWMETWQFRSNNLHIWAGFGERIFLKTVSSENSDDWKGNEVTVNVLFALFPNATIPNDNDSPRYGAVHRFVPRLVMTEHLSRQITEDFYLRSKNELFFVTCAQQFLYDFLSFTGYISAFHWNCWLALGTSWIASSLTFYKILDLTSNGLHSKLQSSDLFKTASFVLNLLVCQSASIINRCKWIGGTWIMVGIILSSLYQGGNIEKLVSPRQRHTLNSFEELAEQNFTYYSTLESWLGKQDNDALENLGLGPMYFQYVQKFSDTYNESDKKWNLVESIYDKMHLAYENLFDGPEKSNSIRRRISRCTKAAFIGTRAEVSSVFEDVSKLISNNDLVDSSLLVVGENPLDIIHDRWTFSLMPLAATPFQIRKHSLQESGLVGMWTSWKHRLDTWNETVERAVQEYESKKPKGISIVGNAVVIFIAASVLLLIASMLFLIESRKSLFHVFMNRLKCGKTNVDKF